MKKLIAIILTLVLVLSLTVPASAATTMRWDWGKAQTSIGKAISGMVQEQQTEPTEPAATEYIMAEEPVEADKEYLTTAPAVEPVQEKKESWRDWLRRWSWCVEGWK